MIFSIIILLLVGVIAFFHYTQGFFSAAISALLAAISAALALSYEEVIVNNWLAGKFADEANAIVLLVSFAVIYCVLRFIFDAVIPGNVRLPVLMDKIGAGVMGLIAGFFAAGIVAIAAQMLPFGPTIAGYERFPTNDTRSVVLQTPGFGQARDVDIHDELKNDTFDPDSQKKMILPVDDWVVGFVSYLSQPSGALAGAQPVTAIHPDWLNELFADRLGIEVGGKHVAYNAGKMQQVQVAGVYAPESLPQVSGESTDIRQTQPAASVKSSSGQLLLVVRTMFNRDATDEDNLLRFSTATCRLVANGKVYYAIGTVADGNTLVASKLDDPLFIEIAGGDKGADLAFLVPPSDVLAPTTKGQPPHLAEGVLLQVKRLGWVDLANKPVSPSMPASTDVALLRKPDVQKKIHPPEEEVAAPLSYQDIQTSDKIFTEINVGTPDADVKDQQLNSGVVSLHGSKFTKLDINPTDTIQKMRQGGYPISELAAANGKVIIQISARPSGDNPWAWADTLGEFTLVDTDGHKYKPSGALAKLKAPTGQDKLAAEYNVATPVTSMSPVEGRPTDVWVIYQVPAGTHAKQWDYQGKLAHAINQ